MTKKDHKLAAIVFTDIVGYTQQMAENELLTMQLLQKQREIVFPIVESHGGQVVKEIGDGLLIMFSSAVDAVRFATETQFLLKDDELTIRAGIHIGDVIFKDGDVFGSAVNTAARIEPLAPPNGICISENVRAQISNKEDIKTHSIGKKALKGLSEPLEIFEIHLEGITQKQKITPANILKELWNRRVIQILVAYILSSWIITQAVDAMVSKYLLSPYLTDLTWVVLLSLLPSVGLLAWFHGKASSAKWHKLELVGMPVNIILSIVIAVVVFQGKDLGAATTAVMVENEDGLLIERTVLKNEFRKKIALYSFENLSNDTTLDWMQYTIPTMVQYDLSQDLYIESISSVSFFEKLSEAGYPDGTGLPIALMKKFANYYHLNYFVVGDFTIVDGEYTFNTKLYESRNGKLISESSFKGNDVFTLTDEITVKIKQDVGIPESHINNTDDLPIDEIFTGSMKSLEYFSLGHKALLQRDWEKGISYFEGAVEEDPGFAIGYLTLANIYFSANQPDKATLALQSAMSLVDEVPERAQFQIKYFNYLMDQKPDKAMAVIKMWAKLFPSDIQAHATLAQRYMMSGNNAGAIETYKTILRLDPEQYAYLITIGDLMEAVGKPDSALMYYKMYADQFPKDYQSYSKIGEHYMKNAEFEMAGEYYGEANLLEPSIISISIDLAKIESRTGQFDLAEKHLFELMEDCKTTQDSLDVYRAISSLFRQRGQINSSLHYFDNGVNLAQEIMTPLQVSVQRAFTIGYYIEAGQNERAFEILEKIKAEFEPPLDKVASFGYLFAYLELEDPDKAEAEIPGAEELAKGFGEESLLANVYFAYGRIYEMRGEYEKAIENFQTFRELQPTSYSLNIYLCECYRELGENKEAEKYIIDALKHYPYNAKVSFEAALIYLNLGEDEKALEHLRLANEIWIAADASFKPAIEAREKLEEVEGV